MQFDQLFFGLQVDMAIGPGREFCHALNLVCHFSVLFKMAHRRASFAKVSPLPSVVLQRSDDSDDTVKPFERERERRGILMCFLAVGHENDDL